MRAFLLLLLLPGLAFAQETGSSEAIPVEVGEPADEAPAAEPLLVRYRFEPRAEAQAGWRFVESSTWTVKGSNDVKVAGASVRKGPIDRLNSHRVDVSYVEVKDGRPFVFDVLVREQVTRKDGELDELGLDGANVRMSGRSGARGIERVDGGRLKRKQKKWLQDQFGGTAGGADIDPVELLLPERDIAPGDSWDISLDSIQGYFGTERFLLDTEASRARATLESVAVENGVDTGTFSFDVLIVPASMKNAEFTEASMTITGTAKLPVQGDVPWFAYDVDTSLRFVGVFKRGVIRANADLDMQMHGVDARRAP